MLLLAAILATTPVHSNTPAGDWFIQAGASGDGKSATSPTGSFTIIERQSREGETIILLAGDATLDGGLSLKAGQALIGVSASGRKPVITNTDSTRNSGCGIVLADDNHVSNLRIENVHSSGIYAPRLSTARIDGVDIKGANLSASFVEAKYPTLPGSLPHGGMVFVHSGALAQVEVVSSEVIESAGFGVVSITSGSAHSRLSLSQVKLQGGTKIGFFDVGLAALVQGSSANVQLNVSDSEVGGRLSRSGRNIMVVASSGGIASARIERFVSGPTGQDGIVGAVMQSPSEISLNISDSLIEGAAQMNIEGTLVNLPPDDLSQANKGSISIDIEGSTIRNAGAVGGFEDVAANIWLGASQFLEDQPPALGRYQLHVRDSTIEGAGRSGLEFGDLPLLTMGQVDKSTYKVVLKSNTIVNNGAAEVMIYAPHARIDARGNCWGPPGGLAMDRVAIYPPAGLDQLDASEPVCCRTDPCRTSKNF